MIKVEEIRALVEKIDRRFIVAVPYGHSGEPIRNEDARISSVEWETVRAAIFYGVETDKEPSHES